MTENNLENPNNKTDDQELVDKMEALPKDKKQEIIAMAKLEMYSGPIPHPDIIKGYEEVYPGAAKKIIDNGVEESNHRRHMESQRQKRKGRLAWFSLLSFVMIAALFMWFGYSLIMHGHSIIGSIFGGVGFVTGLGTLINNVTELTSKDDISVDKDN